MGGLYDLWQPLQLMDELPGGGGKEMDTTLCMGRLLRSTFRVLSKWTSVGKPITIHHNPAGSISSGEAMPGTLAVCGQASLLIGFNKEPGMLPYPAFKDLKACTSGGLPAGHYGLIPGLPGYIALGATLQWCFIRRDGQVRHTHYWPNVVEQQLPTLTQIFLQAS
jgi:hypothetical protein